MNEFLFRFCISMLVALPFYIWNFKSRPKTWQFVEWRKWQFVFYFVNIALSWVSQFIPWLEWLYRLSPPFSGFFMCSLIIHSGFCFLYDYTWYKIERS